MPVSDDMIDVYAAYDPQLAERVVELLQDAGLAPFVRDRSSAAFPTTMGRSAQLLIAVPAMNTGTAMAALRAAVDDGIINAADGELLST